MCFSDKGNVFLQKGNRNKLSKWPDLAANSLKIEDRFVESRAMATLPSNYLYIKQIMWGDSSGGRGGNNSRTVMAKKLIPKSCQFGPLEGSVIRYMHPSFSFSSLALGDKSSE